MALLQSQPLYIPSFPTSPINRSAHSSLCKWHATTLSRNDGESVNQVPLYVSWWCMQWQLQRWCIKSRFEMLSRLIKKVIQRKRFTNCLNNQYNQLKAFFKFCFTFLNVGNGCFLLSSIEYTVYLGLDCWLNKTGQRNYVYIKLIWNSILHWWKYNAGFCFLLT